MLISRRDLLKTVGAGFGAFSHAGLEAKTHFAPKAKRVIFIFLNGGPSQVDTFDPKPMLTKYHGKALPTANLRTERKTGAALGSPFGFKKYGVAYHPGALKFFKDRNLTPTALE